jgi:hypothetical protein
VDNWSGASLLPSLYQGLRSQQRRHTFVFAAFAGEEKGLVGSDFYVRTLPASEVPKMKAMVNLETLGLGPTEVWASRSDPGLLRLLDSLAHALNLPLTGVNVDKIGYSDEESFIKRKVPAVIIHSLTQATIQLLHSPKDNYDAIHIQDYYDSCRLVSGFLVLLDDKIDRLLHSAANHLRHSLFVLPSLLQCLINAEAGWFLPRGEVLKCLKKLTHYGLGRDQHKHSISSPFGVIQSSVYVSAFEWIGP